MSKEVANVDSFDPEDVLYFDVPGRGEDVEVYRVYGYKVIGPGVVVGRMIADNEFGIEVAEALGLNIFRPQDQSSIEAKRSIYYYLIGWFSNGMFCSPFFLSCASVATMPGELGPWTDIPQIGVTTVLNASPVLKDTIKRASDILKKTSFSGPFGFVFVDDMQFVKWITPCGCMGGLDLVKGDREEFLSLIANGVVQTISIKESYAVFALVMDKWYGSEKPECEMKGGVGANVEDAFSVLYENLPRNHPYMRYRIDGVSLKESLEKGLSLFNQNLA